MVQYILQRSDRKTLSLRLLPDGSVEVRAPRRLEKKEIDLFVTEKQPWILRHQAKLAASRTEVISRRILFQGQWKDILAGAGNRMDFDGENFLAPEDWNDEQIRTGVEHIYKKLAGKILKPLVMEMGAVRGKVPDRVIITGARTRWGSCSRKNSVPGVNISLSWRLLASPPDCIRYVILHELTHMDHMDHSRAFWKQVERDCPDWKEKREKLTEIGRWLWSYFG